MSLIVATLALSLSLAPQEAATPTQPDLSWMAGYWLDCANGREASETWSDPRNGLIAGVAVSTQRGRTSFEASTIRQTPEGLAYLAQPNGAPPTPFVWIEGGPMRAVFENTENDFPNRIIYERDGDRLEARIEGVINGQPRSMAWSFTVQPLNTRCPA